MPKIPGNNLCILFRPIVTIGKNPLGYISFLLVVREVLEIIDFTIQTFVRLFVFTSFAYKKKKNYCEDNFISMFKDTTRHK
jgi:hypothetical protein